MRWPRTDPARVMDEARLEIAEEIFRKAVEAQKTRLRAKRWYHKLFPFTITITRKT